MGKVTLLYITTYFYSTLKNKEYEVIGKIEYQLKMLGHNETNDRKHC